VSGRRLPLVAGLLIAAVAGYQWLTSRPPTPAPAPTAPVAPAPGPAPAPTAVAPKSSKTNPAAYALRAENSWPPMEIGRAHV
jgi:hypothetical protein